MFGGKFQVWDIQITEKCITKLGGGGGGDEVDILTYARQIKLSTRY